MAKLAEWECGRAVARWSGLWRSLHLGRESKILPSSAWSVTRTAHSLACSSMLASIVRSAVFSRSLTASLIRLLSSSKYSVRFDPIFQLFWSIVGWNWKRGKTTQIRKPLGEGAWKWSWRETGLTKSTQGRNEEEHKIFWIFSRLKWSDFAWSSL